MPSDMNIYPKPEFISIEIIMDGRVMGENLRRIGLDEEWLKLELRSQGYQSPKDIFLGLCDNEKKTTFYGIK